MYMAQFNQFEGNENVIEKLKKKVYRSTESNDYFLLYLLVF